MSEAFQPVDGAAQSAFFRQCIEKGLDAQGFYGYGFLSRQALLGVLEKTAVPRETLRKYDIDSAKSAVAVALRYGEGLYPPPSWAAPRFDDAGFPPPHRERAPHKDASAILDQQGVLRIARFARANWYGELGRRLEKVVSRAVDAASRRGLQTPPPKAWHRLVNSGIPEKPLAVRAGLGWIGRNGILIAKRANAGEAGEPKYSSAVVLGILLCPVPVEAEEAAAQPNLCGTCRRCIDACPTRALDSGPAGGYDRNLCIQHWSALEGILPEIVEKSRGNRLYGCDSCLEPCPHFKPDGAAHTVRGLLGPALPARYFLSADDATIRKNFKDTALGRTWMSPEAFRRNARGALGR